ncbi:aminotransferase class V-fold PLP-dependent enzyme [Massilia sp. DJPM01]|uniref:aminotransferase class V-fold PLP-dependent enzyme n=1 Tax=Massilia sp. DJPM01 TaxID=3024404 RepID=UPI00259FB3A4|nr:aminotransferase class V-fold PLP-dependent enzyme [Massilia sp. DJPM01]MDM5179166.1 aminotransferase class V-fold PLP-dependent enzyme [Massilia sp. DJPM01]
MQVTPTTDVTVTRTQMALDARVTYLNAGSFGPPSRRTADTVAALRDQLVRDPMDFQLRQVPALLWTARARLAQFLDADPARLLFTSNVTEAVSVVAASMALQGPAEILMSDQEYAPMRWCWERVAARCGMQVRTFALPARPDDPGEIVQAAASAMNGRTRVLFVSHVLSATGMILPVRELCAMARRRAIVSVVDGAHGPGFLPLALRDLDCDYYAGSGHKWLMAPAGTGFLYAGSAAVESLEPLHVSGGFHLPEGPQALHERDRFGSTPALRRLECAGTRDICPWLAVPAAIDFFESHGSAEVFQRMRESSDATRARLRGLRGLACMTPVRAGLYGGMTSFVLPPGCDAGALQRQLWEQYRVEVGMAQWGTVPLIRVSTHCFNTEAELDLLARALEVLLT